MALVIEDGSLVTGATSYVTVAEARAYASARGVTLPAVDGDVEQLAVKAIDYLEAQRARYQGSKVDADQDLQWPRVNVVIDGNEYPETSIPKVLKSAQCQLMIEAANGVDLMPTRTGGFVKKEKVDVIETEYSEKIGTGVQPDMTAVEALLAPLFNATGSGFALTTLRV